MNYENKLVKYAIQIKKIIKSIVKKNSVILFLHEK